MTTSLSTTTTCEFTITVLGRTLEHLGVQMYKRRDTAISELVANCWDAGAKNVHIYVPEKEVYDPASSPIVIDDDGFGMNPDQIQKQYLVVGRNRRQDGGVVAGRPVMGRKGIGKLAGFGIATEMTVLTWREDKSTEFVLDINNLKKEDNTAGPVPVRGTLGDVPSFAKSPTGTRLTLQYLKHKTSVDIDKLQEALARRFSRKIRGEMRIYVNGDEVGEPAIETEQRNPAEGYITEQLSDGSEVKYYYAFSKTTIKSPELRGFTIYVRGKTAQAPPFFFNVEGTASGQHATKYVTGVIEADFLDEGIDDESDLISTDRQEIDWENDRVKLLFEWGDALARRALRECTARKGEKMRDWILRNESLSQRIARLDNSSRKQVSRFLLILGEAEAEQDRTLELSDSLVRAFEYRNFHDVISEIETVSDDPEELKTLLGYLSEWKVLESRAILEIIKGRLEIIEKFHGMIVNDAAETAHKTGDDNMHDMIADYPWILNPEWQVLAEEKSISKQLEEWNAEDITDEDHRLRYDFLALSDDRRLVVIEIKRSGHPVELNELHRLEEYKVRLSRAQKKGLHMVLICGGSYNLKKKQLKPWRERDDFEIREWSDIYEKTRTYYKHYMAVLEGDVDSSDFTNKELEVARTRDVLEKGTVYRGTEVRKGGLGPQDVSYQSTPSSSPPKQVVRKLHKKT